MLNLIGKPPVSDPPELPPFLRGGDRRPRRDVWIAPDIVHCETRTKTQHNNCWTIHYVWMNRVWGFFERVEVAHVNSRAYRQWLELHPDSFHDGIPPHIQFGGAVETIPGGDPTFKARWVEYAKRTFC